MEVFIGFLFWYYLVAVVVRLLTIAGSDYPRITKHSIGLDFFGFVISGCILGWAAYVKYAI